MKSECPPEHAFNEDTAVHARCSSLSSFSVYIREHSQSRMWGRRHRASSTNSKHDPQVTQVVGVFGVGPPCTERSPGTYGTSAHTGAGRCGPRCWNRYRRHRSTSGSSIDPPVHESPCLSVPVARCPLCLMTVQSSVRASLGLPSLLRARTVQRQWGKKCTPKL